MYFVYDKSQSTISYTLNREDRRTVRVQCFHWIYLVTPLFLFIHMWKYACTKLWINIERSLMRKFVKKFSNRSNSYFVKFLISFSNGFLRIKNGTRDKNKRILIKMLRIHLPLPCLRREEDIANRRNKLNRSVTYERENGFRLFFQIVEANLTVILDDREILGEDGFEWHHAVVTRHEFRCQSVGLVSWSYERLNKEGMFGTTRA